MFGQRHFFGQRNWGQLDNNTNHIVFSRITPPSKQYSYSIPTIDYNNSQSIFLLSKFCNFNIFDYIPRLFTISTKTSSCKFNIEFLKDTSSLISDLLNKDPNALEYVLPISDEENVLKKFELLYQGKEVVFDEDELPSSQRITKILKIINCPNYLKPDSLKINEVDTNCNSVFSLNTDFKSGVKINMNYFINYLRKDILRTFTIVTNKKEYKCNIFGVYSSKIIREILAKDSTTTKFIYDFEDEYDEFQSICDLFNFKVVDITSNNMNILKDFAEDLQIECILHQIDDFICNYTKVSKKIDEQQTIIDSIDQLFDWLYNIKEITVNSVKTFIIQSKWVENIENIQELAAFILQIIKTDYNLHNEIADLLFQLDLEANKTNSLNILFPFIIQNLMSLFDPFQNNIFSKSMSEKFRVSTYYSEKLSFAFIYLLYKKGKITKDEIIGELKLFDYWNQYSDILAFFLPEIYELYPNKVQSLINNAANQKPSKMTFPSKYEKFCMFISKYLPDKIDLYKRMLDNGEPDDELTHSLRHDDVDTLQSFITRLAIDIPKFNVPYNIYDNFNTNVSIINYAAAFGSVKCFKYLLLNNGQIDDQSFYFAVYGGNIEIIKIVDNHMNNNKQQKNYSKNKYPFGSIDYSSDDCIISPSIYKHKNELFDWIFQKKFESKGKAGNDLNKIAIDSVISGNAHSLIEIIDKGFDISSKQSRKLIYKAAENGFYKLTQLIFNIIDKYTKKSTIKVSNPYGFNEPFEYQSISFGNINIFKLFVKQMSQDDFEKSFLFAIEKDYIKIINYYFDELINHIFFLTKKFIKSALNASIIKKTDDLFNFLLEKFKALNPDAFEIDLLDDLIIVACQNKNISITKKLTDLILIDIPDADFSTPFIKAASSGSINICQFFIDEKLHIDYEALSFNTSDLGSVDTELFKIITKNVCSETKQNMLKCLPEAIKKQNKNLVEFLLKEGSSYETALFDAVNTDNLEIVKIILEHDSKPPFINKLTIKGTVLHVAVYRNNLPIVKCLLSLPGIDPSLTNGENETSLSYAIVNYKLKIVEAILDFYGDEILNHFWMLINAIQKISSVISSNNNIANNNDYWQIIIRILEIKGIDPNYSDQSTFLYKACQYNKSEFVESFLKLENIDVNKYAYRTANTPLIAALDNKNIDIAKLLIEFPKTNINFRNYNNESALIFAVKYNLEPIVDLLIHDERFDPVESRLNFAFAIADVEIAKILASIEYLDVNISLNSEFSNQNIFYYMTKITTLVNTVENNNEEKVDLIIQHPYFDKEKSNLIEAIYKSVEKNNPFLFRKLFKLIDSDINIPYKNYTFLEYAASNLSGEIINDLFNDPSFDSEKSNIVSAFELSYAHSCMKQILKSELNPNLLPQLPPFDNEPQNPNQQPFLPPQNLNQQLFIPPPIPNQLPLLPPQNLNQQLFIPPPLPNQQQFMPPQNLNQQQFLNNQRPNQPAFMPNAAPLDNLQAQNTQFVPQKQTVVETMEQIYKYDKSHKNLIDFTKLLQNGNSFFTVLFFNIDEIGDVTNYLLEHGVDPNAPDEFGVYPLENAIRKKFYESFIVLLNSNKVNLNQVIRSETYLHLAAKIDDSRFLIKLLDTNLFDINATDDKGETPLIKASKYKIVGNIAVLFEKNDLDYLHCNKNGKNALTIISTLSKNENSQAEKSRESFNEKLIQQCQKQ